ncbi:hypothetical protein F0P96_14595 [Hymenobacter busanensis]|uniref:Uncharacterized protein n=1 Tax=Hymenobacter busanensis TaxID=2607656 RepID=A0A7L4ZYR5_9BACT|nr:hypothetical protein [Hymenobacter busanensis]KAA9331469.1 hypothetical protein F0P96_14595 [Hymenobacter busanensis]QHJ08624.1 hypothetical protein GUY19_15530 [Hymenobacter busanensis]
MANPSRIVLLPIGGLLVAAAAWLSSCSAERHNFVARSYQNLVARDNGYFLAREKMREVEAALYKERPADYNRTLPLLPVVDSVKAVQLAADLDDVVKKASLPIQRRPGSDFTDDSYILVGKTRFYRREFEDATKTFKYVNTTSNDPNAKHEALIWLMRTYMATQEWDNAAYVSSLLDKEKGTERNARELFLTRAQYYIWQGDEKQAIENLNKAIPYIPQKDERSRTRYVLAQLYQNQGQDKEAYAQLNQILKRNPPYELDFFSKLMLGQVSDLSQTDRARLDKYFAKLLKDPKNKEYRDKIYYEMARLEYRQQHYDKALGLLNQSVRNNTQNRAQKAYAYLLSGRIYYENLQKYRLAAAYYDSTTQSLPREAPEYAATAERRDILRDFAQQLTTIETQDSLLTLAKLDTATLRTRLLAYADAALKAQEKEAERQALLAARSANQTATGQDPSRTGDPNIDPLAFANASTGKQWYFDNPTSLGTARADFQRQWGDRPLTDNWRLSSLATQAPVANGGAPVSVGGSADSNVNPPAQASADPAKLRADLVAQYRQQIPFGTEAQQQAEAKIEDATYALAAIYSQQLKELPKSAETYEQFVTRFPRSKRLPEVYYSAYLVNKEVPDAPKAERYAQQLREQFPNSSYARLVADPEYLRRTSVANQQMSAVLDSAFALYKKQEFKKATAAVARARKQYPQTDLNDRADYLQLLLTLRTQPPATHKAAVEAFAKKYPESPLVAKAQDYLASYSKYEAGQLAGALASTEKPRVSFFRPGEVDTRMRISTEEYETPTPAPAAGTPNKPADKAPVTKEAPKTKTPGKTSTPATSAKTPAKDAPAATPTPAETGKPMTPEQPAAAPAVVPPAGSAGPAPAPVSPYKADLNAAQAVVISFPTNNAAFKDLQTQVAAYNNRFYKASNLQIQPQTVGENTLLVVQPLAGSKVAQNYALKLRGPQGPLMKLRNAGYQSFLIGIDNLPVLLQRGNLEEYLQFFQQTYRP